ncbi:MAG: in-like serine protease [Planctomycetota bacterium]|nr:in-like serine protease [Planctomycetota bacterium]
MDTIEAAVTRDTYHVDGTGLSAAMIDTGVDYTNPALGGDGYGPGHKVVDGFEFSQNVSNPYPVNPHGTMTAGLVASSDKTYPGVAPGANIVALRVIGDDGSGDFDRVARALQFVIDHHVKDKISVVNISLSDGGNYPYDFFTHDNSIGQRIAGLIHQLDQLNIPVVTAAGNSFDGILPGMGFPSILSESISVTGTDQADHFLTNAQRLGAADGFAAATDLAAPGKDLTAPGSDKTWTTVEGTSFSAPLVTGGIVLLQQIYQQRFGSLPKVDDLLTWLKGGAKTIHDPVTGIDLGRLNLAKSASLIPQAPNTTPTDPGPQTQVFVDGILKATVPATAASNPLSDFGSDAGSPLDFDLIQLWQNGQSTTISLPAQTGANASYFNKVEIFNAHTTGVAVGSPITNSTPVAATVPTTPKPAATVKVPVAQTDSGSVRPVSIRAFHRTIAKGQSGIPRPSSFARRGKHR